MYRIPQARRGRSNSSRGTMQTRAACIFIALVFAISGCAVRAAIDDGEDGGGGGGGGGRKKYALADLRPLSDTKFKHAHYWQIPDSPRGVVMMIHGCKSSAYNWFPQSNACRECRGLPEQLSHTLQALNRGYAVIAISSGDRDTGCWSWWDDCYEVTDLMKAWLKEWGLERLPLYGLGVSSGASFALKMPRFLKFSGVLSEALGLDPEKWGYDQVVGGYPPTVFISMVNDERTHAKIMLDVSVLRNESRPVEVIKVYPRLVYPTYFSDRSPYMDDRLSHKIVNGLRKIKMIDRKGNVLEDPRYTKRPWLRELQKAVPDLGGRSELDGGRAIPVWPENPDDVNSRAVWSLMNLAYAHHEIISDYVTPTLMWFETGGRANMNELVAKFTYGLPPPEYRPRLRRRQAAEVESAEDLAALSLSAAAEGAAAALAGGEGAVGRPVVAATMAGSATDADEELLAAAWEAEQALDRTQTTTAPVAPATSQPAAAAAVGAVPAAAAAAVGAVPAAAAASVSAEAATEEPGGFGLSLRLRHVVGGAIGGFAGMALLACLAWFVVSRRRAADQIGLISSTMHAVVMQAAHPQPGVNARLSIIPGVKERFELTEVVEQTGSPYSARRRNKTAFSRESPRKTPIVM